MLQRLAFSEIYLWRPGTSCPDNGQLFPYLNRGLLVESGCGAVALGGAYLLPPLSGLAVPQ